MDKLKQIDINKFMYIIFGMYIFSLVFTNTVLNEISDFFYITLKLVRYICYIAFIFKIVLDLKEDKKITLSMIIFTIITFIVFIFSNNKNIVFFCLGFMAFRKLEIDKLLKIAYNVTFIIFFSIVTLSLLGLIPDWTFLRGTLVRHSLGFIYATDCIGIFLAIILMYFYIKKSKANILEIITFEFINVVLYKFTDGRLSFILITILLITLVISKIKIIKNILKSKFVISIMKIICYSAPVVLLITFNCLTYVYSKNYNSNIDKINKLLSGRLEFTAKAYEKYGVPVFGKNIEWHGWGGYGYVNLEEMDNFEYNFVDSSYAKIIFDYGIIYMLLIIFAYQYMLIKNFNDKNYWIVASLLFVLIWSFIEPYIINLGRNPLILLLIPILEIKAINLKRLGEVKESIEKNTI